MFEEETTNMGGPTRPIHLVGDTWNEHTKRLEDSVRDTKAFRGQWQTYREDDQLRIPPEYVEHFKGGGAITISDNGHLLLFGTIHWALYQRWLAHTLRRNPQDKLTRAIYRNAYEFEPIKDGFIKVPAVLSNHVRLGREIALIGMVYYFEVYNKNTYLNLEKVVNPNKWVAFIKRLLNNSKHK